jgi:hypothetical protein
MKSIFDKTTREELIGRINNLNENSTAQWGKMNVSQMIKHCILCEEMYLGRKKYKRAFIGRLFGRMALKNLLKDEQPLQRNAPTSADFKIKETGGNVSSEKKKWIALLEEYEHFSNDNFVHWFFGRMSKEQVGYFAYKHSDHHLRQFNA